jgi:hypothetical protein
MNPTIERNFAYHPPTDIRVNLLHAGVRRRARDLAAWIDEHLPAEAGREKATAITHIETAMMWACAGLVRTAPAPTAIDKASDEVADKGAKASQEVAK